MSKVHEILFKQGLIKKDQVDFLDAIESKKVVSLYSELRLVLYLGILLFTGGVGYIAYENIGELGHILLMLLMACLILGSSYFIHEKSAPFSREEVSKKQIYVDYILILNSLLIISLFTYTQVYFDVVEQFVNWTSLLSAILFFIMAYRYDNKGVLSLGITALAAVFGLSVSPVNWVSGDLVESSSLYVVGIALGVFLFTIGIVVEKVEMKMHFKFTFHNFGLLLFYTGALALIFDGDWEVLSAVVFLVISVLIGRYNWKQKSFLFFLYSVLMVYVLGSYLFMRLLFIDGNESFILALLYFPLSCGGIVTFFIKHKSHFLND